MVQEKDLVCIKQETLYITMYAHLMNDVGIVKRCWKLKTVDTELCEVFWQKANKSFNIDINHVESIR